MNYRERTNRLIWRMVGLADLVFILFMLFVLVTSLYFRHVYDELNRSFELKHMVILIGYLWARSQAKSILGDVGAAPSPDPRSAQGGQ